MKNFASSDKFWSFAFSIFMKKKISQKSHFTFENACINIEKLFHQNSWQCSIFLYFPYLRKICYLMFVIEDSTRQGLASKPGRQIRDEFSDRSANER